LLLFIVYLLFPQSVLQFPNSHSLLQQPDNDEEEDLSVWAVDFDSTIKYDWDYVLQSSLSLKTKSFSPIAAERVSEDNTMR
jgi:hypothetical protein